MSPSKDGSYRTVPFRPERNATLDSLRWAKKRLQIPILVEAEITGVRKAIRDFRRETGQGLSITAWVVSCVARAAAEHPRVHGARKGKKTIITFDDVDVAVLVERDVGTEGGQREPLPMPVVIRRAHEKDPVEIHRDVENARRAHLSPGSTAIDGTVPVWVQSLFLRLPRWARDAFFWRRLLRNPLRIKKTMGTVAVTSAGMAAPGVLSWGVPLTIHPLAVGVGGIARRGYGDKESEVVALTVVFDHAVTDGVPVGRFIHRLQELLKETEILKGTDNAGQEASGRRGRSGWDP